MSETKVSSIENYLRQLGLACLEGARQPRVRRLLFTLLLLAPSTIVQLVRAEQRARRLAA